MSRTYRMRSVRFSFVPFCLAILPGIIQGVARADLMVGNAPLPKADSTTFPGGVGYKEVSLVTISGGGNFDPEKDLADNGTFSYSAANHSLTIDNISVPTNVKHVWFHMTYTPGQSLPQNPGDVFDPAKWPTLTSAGTITPTGAAVKQGHELWITWDIFPQPERETIGLAFPGLNNDWGGIFNIDASTICTPTPEPSSLAIAGLGVVIMVLYARRGRGVSP